MSSYDPLVSIIIPVYNGANYMKEAIDSAIAQTYSNIEIIVVNDGSRDEGATRRIAESYGDKITYYEKENGGCASALNYGIHKMNGEWFSWLSHDDKYYPDKIKNSINVIRANGLEDGKTIINCGSDLIDENGEKIFHPVQNLNEKWNPQIFLKKLFFSPSINGCALLIHKTALSLIGDFDEELTYTPDFDYWIRAALKGISLFSFDECLCRNRVHGKQVSVLQKNKRETDVKKQLLKIVNLLDNSEEGLVDCETVWLFVKSKGYEGYSEPYELILKKNNRLTNKLKMKGIRLYIKNIALKTIKYIYRAIFKKGMD